MLKITRCKQHQPVACLPRRPQIMFDRLELACCERECQKSNPADIYFVESTRALVEQFDLEQVRGDNTPRKTNDGLLASTFGWG